jgi:hypothetical protein
MPISGQAFTVLLVALADNRYPVVFDFPVYGLSDRPPYNWLLKDHLSEVDKPILVLNPNDDLVERTRRALPLMKNGYIHELPHLNHGMLDCATEEIFWILKKFLD